MAAATLAHPGTPARTGVWVGVAAMAMMFAAFISALLVRRGELDWVHVRLPLILYPNTLVLLVSSGTLELARTRVGNHGRPWLPLTLALGVLFVLGQVVAWRSLASQGLLLATNPASAFFYVLTAVHGLHLLGGVAGLTYVRARLQRDPGPAAVGALDAARVYWHFLAALWVILLLILTISG